MIYLNSFGEDLRSPLQRIILYRNNFDRECRRYCFIKPDYEASSYFITQIVTIRHQRLSTNLDRYISASGPIINSKYRILHCAGKVTSKLTTSCTCQFSSKPSPVWNTLLLRIIRNSVQIRRASHIQPSSCIRIYIRSRIRLIDTQQHQIYSIFISIRINLISSIPGNVPFSLHANHEE